MFSTKSECPKCGGCGEYWEPLTETYEPCLYIYFKDECPTCEGCGTVEDPHTMEDFECPDCGGCGYV